jgi:hypothetical protein
MKGYSFMFGLMFFMMIKGCNLFFLGDGSKDPERDCEEFDEMITNTWW